MKCTSANVLYPDTSVPKPYAAMLLLHGLSDDHTIWQRRTSIERYAEGLPLVIVMPDAGRSFYCNEPNGPQYLTAIGTELPTLISSMFQVEGPWCTTGLSMGGYGAFRIALERPNFFCSAVSHSGALMFGHNGPHYNPDDPFCVEFAHVVGDPNPGGPNDLLNLAKSASTLPALRFDCGKDDFLLNANRALHQMLNEAQIPHQYEEFEGDHNWAYWDEHVKEALAFHMQHFA